jgi:hypothetical protein
MNDNFIHFILYYQAKDVYNPDNADHRKLKIALIDTLELLHANGQIGDGMYAQEREFFGLTKL